MSAPTHTLAHIVCGWCSTLIRSVHWPYSEEYGAETTSHTLCETCFDECFAEDLAPLGEAA